MAAIDDLFDWLQAVIGQDFHVVDGGFPDAQFKKDHVCVVRGMGGQGPDVEDRYPRYRLVLLGPEKNRPAKDRVRDAAEAVMQACLGDTVPCGAAAARALGEPIGPSYTTEDRAWMSVDLQLTY